MVSVAIKIKQEPALRGLAYQAHMEDRQKRDIAKRRKTDPSGPSDAPGIIITTTAVPPCIPFKPFSTFCRRFYCSNRLKAAFRILNFY